MHMALSPGDWLDKHGLFCNRYHARFAPETCLKNRMQQDDTLCTGCSGLEETARELPRPKPDIVQSEPEPGQDPMSQALAGALQEILNIDENVCLPEDESEDFPVSEPEELNDFHLQMLALLDGDDEPESLRKPRKNNRPHRYAIPLGRCPRCKGYLVTAPEKWCGEYDYDTYRCFACGHRTSPGYEWNRTRKTV